MKDNNGNDWFPYRPRSNIFWLEYMLDKMISEVYYNAKKTAKNHKSGLGKMRSLMKTLGEFSCALDWVRREGNRVD